MSVHLIGVVTLIYLAVSICLWNEGKYGMSLCFLGYTVANVGLMWSMMK